MKRQGWLFEARAFYFVSLALFVLTSAAGCSSGNGSSDDPTTTAGTTWTVTPSGGTFQSADGRVTMVVPPGAVAANVTITPQVLASPGTAPASHTIADGTFVQFDPVTFTQPVTLGFRIPASVPDADVPFVRVFRKPDGSDDWQALARTLDIANRTIEIQTTQFSGFAVFTPGPNDWLVDRPGGDFPGAGNRNGLFVAAGAVNSLYAVRYTQIAPTDMGDPPAGWRYVAESAFDFVWSDPTTQFNPAATYRIRFAGLSIPCDPSLVAIFTRTDFGPTNQWNQDGTTGLNAAVDEATVLVNRLQQHALFCPEQVLPVYAVTRNHGSNRATISVSRVDAGEFVPVISQSYDFTQSDAIELYDDAVIESGVQVSAETLRVATLSDDKFVAGAYTLVDLDLPTNEITTIASLPNSGSGQEFEFSPPGISRDGTTIAARVIYSNSSGNTTRKTVRVYSRQTQALLSETDIPTTDRSDIEAVGNDGTVLLSNRRVNSTAPTVTVVRNGSASLQFSGTIPRLSPGATKAYVVNNGQVEEHDLTNGQARSIPVSPDDFDIILQTSNVLEMRYYRAVTDGCELVQRDLSTNQETVLVPVTPCPNQVDTSGSTIYMMR